MRRIASRRHWMVRCEVGAPVKMVSIQQFLFGKPENQTLISGKSPLCFTVKGRCLFLHSVNYVATFLAFIAGAMTGRQSEELPTQTA